MFLFRLKKERFCSISGEKQDLWEICAYVTFWNVYIDVRNVGHRVRGFGELMEQHKSKRMVKLVTVGRKTSLPRPVSIWFVHLENRLFVRGSNKRQWCKNMKKNPKVNVTIEDFTCSCNAEQIRDEGTVRSLRKSYRSKYHLFDFFVTFFMLRKDAVFYELKEI